MAIFASKRGKGGFFGLAFCRNLKKFQRLAATTKKFDSKKNCWIADPEEGFLAAEIKATKGDQVTVVSAKGEVSQKNFMQILNIEVLINFFEINRFVEKFSNFLKL